ncbi:hypothetical protein [Candidatus Collinsella stercoripullorum]|uniref:hypothetical protein n=1 Tax=Candidatus Collinsella stercoripullorum TaxID=2838522 RepID=UPI0022E0F864|nr:hypothetical protein [Candidatus Collinsella stercoripullorum]
MTKDLDGIYVLSCTETELGFISEGLYAVEKTGRQCLEAGIPDEVDTPVLRDELYLLGDMRAQIDAMFD